MFRTALMPPKTPDEAVSIMRAAFVALSNDGDFIRDYSSIIKAKPIMVSGPDAQEIVATLGKVTPEAKAFLLDYSNQLVK